MPLRPSHLPVLNRHSRTAHCTSSGLQGPLSCGRGKSKMRGPSYLDETILQAIEMLHDAIRYKKNAHHLLCVVKASSYKDVGCGGHQSSRMFKRNVEVFCEAKEVQRRTWSLTSRLQEANHGKGAQHIIAEGRRRAPRRPETVTYVNHADLHEGSREAAPCPYLSLRILTSRRCLV